MDLFYDLLIGRNVVSSVYALLESLKAEVTKEVKPKPLKPVASGLQKTTAKWLQNNKTAIESTFMWKCILYKSVHYIFQ